MAQGPAVMQLKGTLTLNDMRSAMWLHIAPRRPMAVLGLVLLALAAWALFRMFFDSRPYAGSGKWIMLIALLLLLVQFLVIAPMSVKKSFEQHKSLHLEVTCEASEEGLAVSNANGNIRVPWANLLRWKENDRIFLLYVTDRLHYVLPKRFFSQAQDIVAFRELLATHLRKP